MQKTEMAELQKVQAELDADYQAALESIESLRSDNTELNSLIDSQKNELKAQKNKIDGLIWTKRELDKARQEIAQFETLTADYLVQLSDLKTRTEQLSAANAELNSQNVVLTENLNVEKAANQELQQTKATLVSEKTKLTATNSALSSKVELGSAIKINWMSFNGGDINDDGEFKSRKRNKKMEVLRTCFKTETNVVVPAGDEIFYLRILNPAGETLAADDMGSGTLDDKMTGKSMRYTMSGTLTYNNQDTEACMDWKPSYQPEDGEYTVEIYNKGYKVGSGTFKI
jgi:predicted nuclease with TOPRIM domain